MSSDNSSGGEIGGGGRGPQYADCKLNFVTHIATPIPAIIASLKVGDVLDVVLKPPRGPVELITKSKQSAGGILPSLIATLIECISEGYHYKAEVIEKKGGNVQVRIKNA